MKCMLLSTYLIILAFLSIIPCTTALFGKKNRGDKKNDDDSPLAGLDPSLVEEIEKRNNPDAAKTDGKPALSDAELGLSELAKAAQDPKILSETMEMLKDPEIAAEVEAMMKDPIFQAQMKKMADSPEYKAAMNRASAQIEDIQNDPETLTKLKKQAEAMAAEL